jgi:hypothetical protein
MTITADLAVATMTLVRDDDEEPLLRHSMEALARVGRPVFVSDRGSGNGFISFLRSLPNVTAVEPAGSGLVGQVRGSLAAAARSGARFVLYTESDKQEFFETRLPAFIGHAGADESLGVMLAARSSSGFSTFPPMQRFTESTINDLCEGFFGAHGDYSYGPFLLRSDLVPYVHHTAADLGWGWRHFMFAIAHRLGHSIVHVPDDSACPDDQREENDRDRLHRLRQLAQNVRGLEAGMTLPLPRLRR